MLQQATSSIDKVLIKAPFSGSYTLLIKLNAMLVNALMNSTTEMRYDFSVLSVNSNGFECRLNLLDHFIHDSNNGLIPEIVELTKAFNRMFNELHLQLTHAGEVVDVLNIKLILSKWEQTKMLMKNAIRKNEEVEKLISLNDSVFSDPEKIKGAIQANEFIQTYFSKTFNLKLPFINYFDNRPNLLNTATLSWKTNIEQTSVNGRNIEVLSFSEPSTRLGKEFCATAYKTFEDKLQILTLEPVLSENGMHLIERDTGKVLRAEIIKKETADPKWLFMNLEYTLENDLVKFAT